MVPLGSRIELKNSFSSCIPRITSGFFGCKPGALQKIEGQAVGVSGDDSDWLGRSNAALDERQLQQARHRDGNVDRIGRGLLVLEHEAAVAADTLAALRFQLSGRLGDHGTKLWCAIQTHIGFQTRNQLVLDRITVGAGVSHVTGYKRHVGVEQQNPDTVTITFGARVGVINRHGVPLKT